jgi:hypothetical protein
VYADIPGEDGILQFRIGPVIPNLLLVVQLPAHTADLSTGTE